MKKFVTAMATTTVVFLGAAGVNVSAEAHTVEKNDTLWDLSEKYNTSIQTMMDNNNLDSTIIIPGQQISIDGKTTEESNSNTDTYKVESGDTLSGISSAHDVSIKDLKEWNNLSSSLIIVGQELKVQQADQASTNNDQANVEKNEENKVTEQASKPEAKSNNATSAKGETMSVTATAYTAKCDGCSGVTKTGIDLKANPNEKVIAVDPSVIPLGSRVHVEGYGEAIAGDIGGAIKGNKIDLHVPTKDEAYNWGVQTVNVTILD